MPAPWTAGAQARIVGRLHGQQCINVLHFATNDAIADQGSLDELLLQLAQALLECAVTTLLPAVTQDYELVQCDAKRIAPSFSDPILATAANGSVGELGPTSASFVASLVNLRSGVDGKRGRGRLFLPPAGEANITASAIDAGTMAAIAAFGVCLAGKFLGANPSTPWRLGVLSRKDLSGVGGNFDNAFRVVASINPVANVAVMRSRKVGHGS